MADAIARQVRYVVYAKGPALDEQAIDFSLGFYDALARGRTLGEAHAEGRHAVALRHGSSASLHTELIEQPDERTGPRSLSLDLAARGRWHVAIGLRSVTLGRSRSSDLSLCGAPNAVSRLHAELRASDDERKFEISPLGHARVELDGRVISSRTSLHEGCVVAFSSLPLLRVVLRQRGILLLEALAPNQHGLTYVYSPASAVQVGGIHMTRETSRLRVEIDELDFTLGSQQRVTHGELAFETRG